MFNTGQIVNGEMTYVQRECYDIGSSASGSEYGRSNNVEGGRGVNAIPGGHPTELGV